MYDKGTKFSFGKNWEFFLKRLNSDRIDDAKESLKDFLGGEDFIKGKTFVDVGSGSGLFSLSAYLLGAKKVLSIDVDKNSINCTSFLRNKYGNADTWDIIEGSALNKDFISSLGKFDVVYSWGVLHHTGNMYLAFDNVVNLIDKDGLFYLAIYNRYITSKIRRYIKLFYNYTPNPLKFIWIVLHYIYVTILLLFQGKWILNEIKKSTSSRGSGRGMSFHIDVIDWIGGFPYEYATTKEVIDYMKKYDLEPVKIRDASGPACWEILFKKL